MRARSDVEKMAGLMYNQETRRKDRRKKEIRMKKRFLGAMRKAGAILLLAALITTTAAASGAGPRVYINNRQLADNLIYTNTVSWSSALGREESHALALTGVGDVYPIISGKDTMYGGMTISAAIAHAEQQGKNVLAAVNTDFFTMKTGVPDGLVIEDGVYKSSPGKKAAVAFSGEGTVSIHENVAVDIKLEISGSAVSPQNIGKTVGLKNFNKYRVDSGGMYLYSSAFSAVSTRAESDGWYVRFRILEGAPAVSGTMRLEVAETVLSATAAPIGDEYLVLTAATAGGWGAEFEKFTVGDTVTLTTTCSDPALAAAQWVTGGGDVLISGGQVHSGEGGWDAAIAGKNPRTAIGVKADGTVITYVLDGRQSTVSNGLTLYDLALELLSLGCVTAVNLDGGGSSALSVRMPGSAACAVVNKPSDGAERKCGAYMLFVTDRLPDGAAQNLAIKNDGITLLAGSSVPLNYVATDAGFMPVSPPGDIEAASAGLGTVSGGVYTAGSAGGTDRLTLFSSSTGARGTAEIHIINHPTSLKVTDAGTGRAVTDLLLFPGESVALSPVATYYYRSVTAQVPSFTFTVTGGVGGVDTSGVFVAGDTVGASGAITVSAGDKTAVVNVTVCGFEDIAAHWAREFIEELARAGIVSGVTTVTFAPESSIKRGDFLLMLHRAAGSPKAAVSDSFGDISPGDYYAGAVAWAKACGIATGTGDGMFRPQEPLTREQAFTFVYRACHALNIPARDVGTDVLAGFGDHGSISDYARTPTAALVGMGIVEGADGAINPGGRLTRSQMAKILCVTLRGAGV